MQPLELVCQKIGDGKLVRVRALAERYTALTHLSRPFVSKIEIKPVKGHGAEE